MNALNRKLLELGRNEDIVKATTDSEYNNSFLKNLGCNSLIKGLI